MSGYSSAKATVARDNGSCVNPMTDIVGDWYGL